MSTHKRKKVQSRKHILKFVSVISSITLWFYVLNSEPQIIERKLPVVFLSPAGKAINVNVPKNVNIKVKGSRAFINNLFFQNEKLFIDLNNYPKDQESFPVTIDDTVIPLPFGVELLEVVPKQIVISLEKEIKKYVPVKLKLVGETSHSLKLVRNEHEPKEFMIRGPRSIIKTIGKLTTIPIDMSSLKGEGMIKVPLESIDQRVMIEEFRNIAFNYTVKPNKANKTISDIPIRFVSTVANYKSNIKLATVDILVPDELIEEVNASDIRVIAEIPDEKNGEIQIKLESDLPEGIHLLQIRPESINVWVK